MLGNDDDLLVVPSVSRNEFYDCEIHFELSVIQMFREERKIIFKTKNVLIVVVLADPPLNWGMTEFYYVKDGQKRKNKF